MATQKCPKCGSKRVRQGYRHTSIFLKLIFRYHLLCNNCNWEFVGFAIPGTLSNKTKSKKKYPDPNLKRPVNLEKESKQSFESVINSNFTSENDEQSKNLVNSSPQKIRVRKRVKVRF